MDTTLYEKLLQASFRFVSYRPRSEKEIREFLQKKLRVWKTAGQVSVTRVMDRLRQYGYVDDDKFAAWWISQRNQFRPKGFRLLQMELAKKGIARSTMEKALKGPKNTEERRDEPSLARQAIQRKLALWGSLPKIEQKKKMYTFLAQRGFSFEVIQAVVDERFKKD